ncbi:AAA family ATPase [Pseudenhygromyxa sp. WMMC2535]|uniref:ATP-binding protein n=1 Tax=Pseudenhygromyxa sp. WMMC2535 TaxID=2712867 RepID=UPI0015566CFD|nr:AAA family ATPase [Pseudenhygromyxa sp. WMMC2535]NVB38677.1 AAA family ATPase [Pseudenhygromyxa sp. WMMC2535]
MATNNFAPQDLGRRSEIDQDKLAPGVILWERFCVVEKARQGSIPITDLERMLGRAPGHLLELFLLELPPTTEERLRLRRALTVESRTQQRVYATIETGRELALISEPIGGRKLEHGPRMIGPAGISTVEVDSRTLITLANDLSALLMRLHAAEVHGVAFSPDALWLEHGRLMLAGFDHLLDEARSPEEDLASLVGLLREVGGKAADPLLRPEPESTRELWKRVRALAGRGAHDDDALELPAEPPFVGRQDVISSLGDGLSRAQIAQPTSLIIRGNRGVGKSRLLREFVTQRLEADDAFVLTGTWQPRSADTRGGLLGSLEQLASVIHSLEIGEQENILHRINRATRNLGAIVTRSAPSLGGVLRVMDELPQVELAGDFSRHTAVIADLLRSIGTQRRPLVLVLDNLENADSRSLAVLRLLCQPRPAHHTLVVAGLRDESRAYEPEFDAEIVDLQPLTTDEISLLLKQVLLGRIDDREGLADALLSVSNGYPLAIWANLRAWLDRGLLVHEAEDTTWRARKSLREEIDYEPDIRDLFGFRLAGAEPKVRALSLRMAVLGLELSMTSARALAEPEDGVDFDAAINDLVERGILTRTNRGVRFPHDSIRELVLESVDANQRREAHQRVAVLLSRQQAPIAQVVYHRDLGFDREAATPEEFDRLSTLHIEAGRDRLAIYDLERARWHLERALETSRDSDQRNLAAEALADVCLLMDDNHTAISLFTAIIAAADKLSAARAASKAIHFLFFNSSADSVQEIGDMALEVVGEPMPKTSFRKLLSVAWTAFISRFKSPPYSRDIRDTLCHMYPTLIAANVSSDPLLTMNYAFRALWMTKDLDTPSVASVLSFMGAIRATLGHYQAADRYFIQATEIAKQAQDSWSRGVTAHNWGHTSLLPSNRYEEGQDVLDDALGFFRETGDMSVALLTLAYKALFGRDREPPDTVLSWLDEAISTAHRNGRDSSLLSLHSIRMVILARQGRSDISVRIIDLSDGVQDNAIPVFDRIIGATQLALAALEIGERKLAYDLVVSGNQLIADMPGVPEFAQELYAATALVILGRQLPTREESKLLRRSLRKLKRGAKSSPRLSVMYELVQLKQAMADRDEPKIRSRASSIIGGYETHGNIYASREAHRALSQLLKVNDVLAAAEHERISRNLGRRLGFGEQALISEFSESMELGALGPVSSSSMSFEAPSASVPAAGMLDSTLVEASHSSTSIVDGDHDEILKAWALSGEDVKNETELSEVIKPVKDALALTMSEAKLEISCPDPRQLIPLAASDLQVLLINLVLSARDAAGNDSEISVELERVNSEEPDQAGRALMIRVHARGSGQQVPMIGGFSACESMLKNMGGELIASTGRARVNLVGRVPLKAPVTPSETSNYIKVVIVHPDTSIRETISTALLELDVDLTELAPADFEPGALEGVDALLADGGTLRGLQVLEPLIEAKLIEIVRRGSDPLSADRTTLRVPFALSELKGILGLNAAAPA